MNRKEIVKANSTWFNGGDHY